MIACRNPACHLTFDSHASMLSHYIDFAHPRPAPAAGTRFVAEPGGLSEENQFYPCDLCPRFFRSERGLHDHLRALHLIAPADLPFYPVAPPVLPPDQPPIADVACNDCGQEFKTTDSLHQHQWDCPHHTRVAASRNPNLGTRHRRCSQCHTKLPSAEDLEHHFVEQHPISEVPMGIHDEETWHVVEGRFRVAWTKPTINLYKVHRIFKVYNQGWRRRYFEEYRKELKREMSGPEMVRQDVPHELRTKILSNGNELHRYHGTTVKCQLGRAAAGGDGGEKEDLSLCSDTGCSLCRILETGFMKEKCRSSRFQRFGKGIYCSSCSSKASAYVNCEKAIARKTRTHLGFLSMCFGNFSSSHSHGSSGEGNCKVMMACRVLAGRPFHTTSNLQRLSGPPPGFHSVQGDPGECLNYDELVIYDDHAILPAYVILYSSSD